MLRKTNSHIISFILAPPHPQMNYLAMNLAKYVWDLLEENYKTLTSEIKGVNKWRDSPCSLGRRLNMVKMSAFPNLIYRLKTIPTKTLVSYFVDIEKPI